MEKRLEEFIRDNRDEIDNLEPDEKVWSRIERSLFGKQRALNSIVFWRAAAILFMGLSTYLLSANLFEKRASEVALNEFRDIELYYAGQIFEKVQLIESSSADVLNGFTHDFQQLEAMYHVLKEEMRARPSEKVKDALVLNLLVRIDLLNQQLNKIERQHKEKGDREKVTV